MESQKKHQDERLSKDKKLEEKYKDAPEVLSILKQYMDFKKND